MAALDSVDVSTTAQGWNEVELDNPITIEDGYGYLISYDFTQGNSEGPLLLDYSVNTDREYQWGMILYGKFGTSGTTYYNFGKGYGEFMIQAVVEGGSFVDDDIALRSLSTDKRFCKAGETLGFSFKIKNDGNGDVYAYKLNATLDGEPIDATFSLPTSLTNSYQKATGTMTLPESITAGQHDMKVQVEIINGITPSDLVFDDTISTNINVYTETCARQKHLVEHFTSQYCQWCPRGYNVLNALTSLRDDIAWVSIHNNMSGYKDVYTVSNAAYISSYALYGTGSGNGVGIPSASFNRTLIDGESYLATSIGYSNANYGANLFNEILEEQSEQYPSFATIDISSTYDATTKKLDLSVTGEGVDGVKDVLGDDAVLTVYLTEDSLVSRQLNGSAWINEYEHNNVLRKIVSAPLGDAITWSGNSYSKSYSTTIDDAWKAENMNIVAFISRPIVYNSSYGFTTSIDDAWVNNAEKVRISNASGISGVVNDAKEAKVVARYTIDGRKIDAPVKGVNIVKLANGKTMKVIVK